MKSRFFSNLRHPVRTLQTAAARARTIALKRTHALPSVRLSEIVDETTVEEDFISDDRGLPRVDLSALVAVARSSAPKTVVELGTSYGNSTANVCRAAPEARIHTVNALPEQLSGILVTWALSKQDIGRVFRSHGYADRVNQVYCDTADLDLSAHIDGCAVDLGVIDACHDPEYVVADFLKVAPFVDRNGIVLLHDTHPNMRGHLWASYLACMNLRGQGYDVRHIQGTWWGAWRPHWA